MVWTDTARAAGCVLLLLAGPAPAAEGGTPDEPLSVIDWLSDTVTAETGDVVPPPLETWAAPPFDVTVRSLDVAPPSEVGLIDPSEIGLPDDLWGRSGAEDLVRAIAQLPLGGPPSLRDLVARVLVARFDPPIDAGQDGAVLLARIDALLARGRLDEARALAERAGLDDPARMRRWFDVALLTGEVSEACRRIEHAPDVSPTYPARIYCLARNGEWDVAALTLGNAEALGILTDAEDKLLMQFLDPVMFEGEPLPRPAPVPSPLEFRLYEAAGERLTTLELPLAFAFADLGGETGWKSRLRAAERLAAAGAIDGRDFLAVVTEHEPAASGGVWDRAAALLRLETARRDGAAVTGRMIADAWAAAREGGTRAALASWLLDAVPSDPTEARARRALFEAAILADRPERARPLAEGDLDLLALAVLQGAPSAARPEGALARSVVAGLTGAAPPEHAAALIADERAGEALFAALTRLAEGADADPRNLGEALATLRVLGAVDAARRIAAELLLADSEA